MKIVIAGDGDTGSHLANTLSIENQDVVMIGSNRTHLEDLEISCNLITHLGNAVSASDLKNCGVDGADLFVAVTNDENKNLISAQIAKRCGAKRCVARVDSPEFIAAPSDELFHDSGVDQLIYPERLAAEDISAFIRHNWVRDWFDVSHGELIVVGVRINGTSELAGKQLKDTVKGPRFFHVNALKRNDDIMIPRGDTEILTGDILYFTVLPDDIGQLCEVCGGRQKKVRKLMITGGGRITENLLSIINGEYSVTIIDIDPDRCRYIASRYPDVVVVNTRASDVTTLKDENIGSYDIFLALTGSSEKNIVSCMVAREHGVERTVARIEDLQYIPEAESLMIDKIINKKLLNAGNILDSLMHTGHDETKCMLLDNAEIIGLSAKSGSKIVSKPVSQLGLPKDITIGGLIREGRGMLVEGSTRIEAGDHVIVFCKIGSLPKVERLFR